MSEKLILPHYPPRFFVRITEKMRSVFLQMYRKFTHPNVVMLEHLQNFWLAAAIKTACELDIAGLLKSDPKTISELAKLTGAHEDSLYRILRVLASQGIFRETKGKTFHQTPFSKSLLKEELGAFISEHLNKMNFQILSELTYTAKTGLNAFGLFIEKGLFEHIGDDAIRNRAFNEAMTSSSMMQAAAVIPAFPFRKFGKVVDIGGGQGLFLAALLTKFPKLAGILFDLVHVVAGAGELFEKYGLTGRIEVIGGSFFETIPDRGDLYILKNIIHDWSDEDALKILTAVRKVTGRAARMILIESIIEEGNIPSFGKMTDVLMMAGTTGRERTKKEYEILLSRAGFRIRKIYRTISPLRIIECENV